MSRSSQTATNDLVKRVKRLHMMPTSKTDETTTTIKSLNSGTCSICFQSATCSYARFDCPRCQHAFHPTCIHSWLVNSAHCPNCRLGYEFTKNEVVRETTTTGEDSTFTIDTDQTTTTASTNIYIRPKETTPDSDSTCSPKRGWKLWMQSMNQGIVFKPYPNTNKSGMLYRVLNPRSGKVEHLVKMNAGCGWQPLTI